MGQQLTNLPQLVNEAQGYLRTKEQEIRTKREQEEQSKLAEQPRLAELQRQLRVNEHEMAVMRQQLEEKDTCIAILQDEQQQFMELQSQLRPNEEEMATMREQLQEKDTYIAILQDELRSRLRPNEDEIMIAMLREQFQEKGRYLASLQEEYQQFVEQQSQLRPNEEEMAMMREQLQEKDIHIAILQEEHQQFVELQSRPRPNEEEMAMMREQLQEKDTHIAILQDENQEFVEQLRTTEQDMETMRQQFDLLSDDPLNQLRTNVSDNPPDWVINRNEIQKTGEELGRGAWGNVVRGKFRRCDVAIKEMYEDILSPQNKHLFEREVDIASKCRHPCLLQFIGATNDERPLLVTELMDCSLRARLYNTDEPPLSEAEVSVISLDVARAVNYLHQKKPTPMIHHDVSSANVLLWRQGNQLRGKLSDYGTANFARQSTRDSPGAAIYCAPEFLNEALNQPISCKVSNRPNKLKNWTKFEGQCFTNNKLQTETYHCLETS